MITVAAPAKINLALHVCGRRGDGYHLLDSLVVFADVGDRIAVAPASTVSLTITGPFAQGLAADADNLVLRAARLLEHVRPKWKPVRPLNMRPNKDLDSVSDSKKRKQSLAAGTQQGAAITLEKNLPVASGIGGGSSDAAATLIACAKLWGMELSDALSPVELTKLGADVPVCLARRPALMRGIGEDVTDLENLPPLWMVLANPGQPLATKAVFGALRGRFGRPMEPLPPKPDADALLTYLAGQRNDLTAPALELMPGIGVILDALAATAGCRLARLSGSGATCFGLYTGDSAARAAAAALKAAHSGWWVAAAPMLTGPL